MYSMFGQKALEEDAERPLTPRRGHASPAPSLGDISQMHVVLIVLWIPQWRGFRISCIVCSLADVRAAQDREALGICRHDPVFDSVVNHLYEMTGTIRATV